MDLKQAFGKVHPGICPMCGPTLFVIKGPWLREEYLCHRCGSIPRQRAFVKIAKAVAPNLATARVFESSPGSLSSAWLEKNCANYQPSQFFADIPRGQTDSHGVRSEDLERLTLPDESIDVLVTQDVFEHILNPDAAAAEIARVLVSGGMHIWTVPIFRGRKTLCRAQADETAGVLHLEEADYHGNPLGGGSLVVHEWGDDLVDRIDGVSGVKTTRYNQPSWLYGIRGEMIDVLVSRKL